MAYPSPFSYDRKLLVGTLCYVIRHYGVAGISMLVDRDWAGPDVVGVTFADWQATKIDLAVTSPLATAAKSFLDTTGRKVIAALQLIKLRRAQFYLAQYDTDLRLVDIRLAADKFSSPGVIRDLFGGIVATQEVLKIEVIDERVLAAVERGSGSYAGALLFKPSRFRIAQGSARPLYVEVRR